MASPGGNPPGAVESGGAGGTSPNTDGVLPPSSGPTPQNVPPQGQEALGMEVMRKITGALHYARMFFGPGSEMLKVVDKLFNQASKHFQPDSETMKGGKMQPPMDMARGQPPSGGPPMAGGGQPPMPQPPRGPIPAQGGGMPA